MEQSKISPRLLNPSSRLVFKICVILGITMVAWLALAKDMDAGSIYAGPNWKDMQWLRQEHPIHGETHHCDYGFEDGLSLNIVKHGFPDRCFDKIENAYRTIDPVRPLTFDILVLGNKPGLSSYYNGHDRQVIIKHVSSRAECIWYSRSNTVNGSYGKSFYTGAFRSGRYELIVRSPSKVHKDLVVSFRIKHGFDVSAGSSSEHSYVTRYGEKDNTTISYSVGRATASRE